MKITMYELLGMIKDGKAPKEINFLGNKYRYDEIDETYRTIIGNTNIGKVHYLEFYLDYQVEILEEEKKLPGKLDLDWQNVFDEQAQQDCIKMIMENINNILDYLKSKGK